MPLDGKIGSGTIAWRYNMLTYSPPSSRTETFLTSSCVPRDLFALSIGRVTRAACQPCVCDWFWYRSRPSGCAGDVSHTLTELENVMERGLALGPAYMDRYVTLIFFKWRSFYFAFFYFFIFCTLCALPPRSSDCLTPRIMENESIQATAWGEGKFSKIFYWKFHCTQKKQRAYLSTWEIYKFLCRNNTHNLSNTFFFADFRAHTEGNHESKKRASSVQQWWFQATKYSRKQNVPDVARRVWRIGGFVRRWSYRNLQAQIYRDCPYHWFDAVVPTK